MRRRHKRLELQWPVLMGTTREVECGTVAWPPLPSRIGSVERKVSMFRRTTAYGRVNEEQRTIPEGADDAQSDEVCRPCRHGWQRRGSLGLWQRISRRVP